MTRSLRQECRLLSHHIMRGLLAAVTLFLFVTVLVDSTHLVGAGGRFSFVVIFCCYWFLSLLGGLYFSAGIVEEKEEQTLPLLRMTGATPFSILAGKSIPRLTVAIMLVLISTPFLILSLTLGGVLIQGLVSAILGILTYAVMLCQVGTLSSVCCRRTSTAFLMTVLIWGLLEFAGPLCWWVGDVANVSTDWHIWFSERSLVLNLDQYLLLWTGNQVWWPQMTFHLAIACGCFVLSWLMFERCTAESVAGTVPPRGSETLAHRGQTTSRPGRNALAWKVRKHTTGGGLWIVLRILVPAPCFVLLVLVVERGDADPRAVGTLCFGGGLVVALINIARLFGQVFNVEIREKTLGGLLMLPVSRSALVFRMLRGLMPAIASACACFGFGFLLMSLPPVNEFDLSDLVDLTTEPGFLHCSTWLAATLVLGMVLSVRMRYGGMLLAVVICGFALPLILIMLLDASRAMEDTWLLWGGLMLLESAACIVLWRQLIADIARRGA